MKTKLFVLLLTFAAIFTSCSKEEDVSVSVSSSQIEIDGKGGSESFIVTSNAPWSITENPSWTSVSPLKGSKGETTVYVEFEANEDSQDRSGQIEISAGDVVKTIELKQKAGSILLLSNTTVNVSRPGEKISVTVSSNVQYTIAIPQTGGWVSRLDTRGVTNTTHEFMVAPNNTAPERRTDILFSENGGTQITLTVIQEGYASAERKALMQLYDQLNGAAWGNSENWKSTQDINTWYGVTTNTDGLVTELSLPQNNLTGNLPEVISSFTELKTLNVQNNALSGAIPDKISELKNLEELKLNNNQLANAIPSGIGELTDLKQLNLSNNKLTGSIPANIGDLLSLEEADLSSNKLNAALPSTINQLVSLKKLKLSDNALTGTFPSVEKLVLLENLDLTDNQLSGEINTSIYNLTRIVDLRLGGNKLGGQISAQIGRLQKLTYLDLGRNTFTGSIPKEIGQLRLLEVFIVKENKITGTIPDEVLNHPNFQKWDPLVNIYEQQPGFVITGGSKLTGTVTNNLGKPVAGASVCLVRTNTQAQHSATTMKRALASQTRKESYVTTLIPQNQIAPKSVKSVNEADGTVLFQSQMKETLQTRGTTNNTDQLICVVTDSYGKYTVPELSPGTYTIRASHEKNASLFSKADINLGANVWNITIISLANNEKKVQWFDDNNLNINFIGKEQGGEIHIASLWDGSDLINADNSSIGMIYFYPNVSGIYKLKITIDGIDLVNGQVENVLPGITNFINISEYGIVINGTSKVQVELSTTHLANVYPFGYTIERAIAGKGDLVSTDGKTWNRLSDMASSVNPGNWHLGMTLKGNPKKLPILATTIVTELSSSSAVLNSKVTEQGTSPVIERGFCLGTSPGLNITNASKLISGLGIGDFSMLTNVQASTRYYVRSYATSSVGTAYGEEVSFITPAVEVPELTSPKVSNISEYTAISNASVSINGSIHITERGFCYARMNNPTLTTGIKVQAGSGTGNIEAFIKDLLPNTTYYIRTYAVTSTGNTYYSSSVSFKTLDNQLPPEVNEFLPEDVLDKLIETGFDVYPGNTPPSIEGTFLVSPLTMIGTTIYNDFPIGHVFGDQIITFYNQNTTNRTVQIKYTQASSEGTGLAGYISGAGNRFTTFVKSTSTESGIVRSIMIQVTSGEWTTDGIKNYKTSIWMLDNKNNEDLISNNTGRVFNDGDFFSPKVLSNYKLQTTKSVNMLPYYIRKK